MTRSGLRTISWMVGTSAFAIIAATIPAAANAQTSVEAQTGVEAQPVPSVEPAPASQAAGEAPQSKDNDIVVTGSRIRRASTDTSAPEVAVDQQSLVDRGYTSAAQALNDLTFNTPALNQAPGNGDSSGSGQQFPNLFNLGPQRTLTLVNGRRMVTSSRGLDNAQVDANIIPIGLLDRVEVVQAGGAAVYGSDAIAGVVNYILKKNFKGVELDGQAGISSRGDYKTYSLRATAGTNFADGRGNIAVDVEWSKSPSLAFKDRPLSNLARVTVSNPADTGPNDGIPSVMELLDTHFWEFNANGVIFAIPAPLPQFLTGLQFSPDGSVVPYDPGDIAGIPFASGGEGFRFSDLAGLRTGVKRITGNVIGHYDLTDRMTLSTELLYADTRGTEFPQGQSHTVLNPAASGAGPIVFTINNPFLTDAAKASLIAASPSFAFGAPLFLSKYFFDLVPDNSQTTRTRTYRGLVSLDGDFDIGPRNFYYSISGSYARVEGEQRNWEVVNSRYNNAINAALDGDGTIVCAINADSDPANDDPACAPINPFGNGNIGELARAYIDTRAGLDYVNDQVDLLATLGGSLFTLPAGDVSFSAAYEHRNEKARFDPLPANQQGLFGTGVMELPQSGSYHTNEYSGELLVPLVGRDFTLPLVHKLELNAAFRHVFNSVAGSENVWNLGARWEVTPDITLRGSRSRNFRAPTLTSLFAPSSTSLDSVGYDPCDSDRITSGPNPSQRFASCLALFEANPGYGVLPDGSNAGASAADRLAHFQDPSENFTTALVTTGGNPDLKNEVSKTLTYGLVLQPRFIPGLTLTADRIQIDLTNGLSPFTTQDFANACMDNVNPPAGVCSAFSRLAQPEDNLPGGAINRGTTTVFNAGVIKYRGEVYNLNYAFPLANLFGGGNLGRMDLSLAATHNSLLTTSVTGDVFVRTDNTIAEPRWSGRLDARYSRGPLRLTYQLFYLGKALAGPDATIENNPHPRIASNMTHSISAEYDFGIVKLRGGITNLFDKSPSYPAISYGDILGRRFYIGATARF
jgi:outer membrane receptor protein involved in Fe transport